MAKIMNQQQLLTAMQEERESLGCFIASLPLDSLEQPGAIAAWSVKDVLAHLAAWHQLLLDWFTCGQRGETPILPAPGYTWRNLRKLNRHLYERHKDMTFDAVINLYNETYRLVWELVECSSEADLFTPSHYAWTGKACLADYVIPCTSHHYQWARKAMRKGLKSNPAKR